MSDRTSFPTPRKTKRSDDNKGAARLDLNTQHFGNIFAYYLVDQFSMNNPYPTQQGGANVPGFNALSDGRAQLLEPRQREDPGRQHRERSALQLHAVRQCHRPAGRRRGAVAGIAGLRRPARVRWESFLSIKASRESKTSPSTTSPSASMSPARRRSTILTAGATICRMSSASTPQDWRQLSSRSDQHQLQFHQQRFVRFSRDRDGF